MREQFACPLYVGVSALGLEDLKTGLPWKLSEWG